MGSRRPIFAFLLKLTAAGLCYFAAGRAGLSIPFSNGIISSFWFPAGIGVATVVLLGYQMWPAIFLGAFLANFFSPIPHTAAVGIGVGNTLAVMATAFLLKQGSFNPELTRLRDVLLLLLAGSLGVLSSASIGVASLYTEGLRAWSSPGSAWIVWWVGDLLGVILVVPLVLSFRNLRYDFARAKEFWVLTVSLTIVAAIVFDNRVVLAVKDQMGAFFLFPFMIWAAVRHGTSTVAVAMNIIALAAI